MLKKEKIARGLILFSGGLDSILVIKVLKEQKIKVEAVTFESCFFKVAESAKKIAKKLDIKLRIINLGKIYLNLVKNPKHGYGKSMNPCIDCHLFMIREAGKIMKKEGFNFVATGEVLGERPMSQNKNAMELIEKESGIEGYLLRPLSAKLLEKTVVEKNGLVEREKMFAIKGRSRKVQIALAKKWKINNYPTPAGGCLLTEIEFSKKLKELFLKVPLCDKNDIGLLRLGRNFWIDNSKIVIGRNEDENNRIKKFQAKNDFLAELKDFRGPIALIRYYSNMGEDNIKKIIEKVGSLIKKYSKDAKFKKDVVLNFWQLGENKNEIIIK